MELIIHHNRPPVLLITAEGRIEIGPGCSNQAAAQVLVDLANKLATTTPSAWMGTPADGGAPGVTLSYETASDWQRYGRKIQPLFLVAAKPYHLAESNGLPPIREDAPLRADEPVGEQHDALMLNRGWNACREAAAALSDRQPVGQETLGWVVADAQGERWRMWGDGPEWTDDRDQALHFSRRADAEAFARDDEDAWLIQPVGTTVEGEKAAVATNPLPESDYRDRAEELLREAKDAWVRAPGSYGVMPDQAITVNVLASLIRDKHLLGGGL